MSMNLSQNAMLLFVEDEASKKASEEKRMAKILKNFEASCSIFNPSSEDVENLKEKFIEFSLKEEAKKEEDSWSVMRHRIIKARELLMKLREAYPDTVHDCLFGCNERFFCFDDMNIGDLCFLVQKSLGELTQRINHREVNGEFAFFPPHYDTGKVAKVAEAEPEAEPEAEAMDYAGADTVALGQGLPEFYAKLYQRFINQDYLKNVDRNENQDNEGAPSVESSHHQDSTDGRDNTNNL